MSLQGQTTGVWSGLVMFTKDGDGTDYIDLQIFGVGQENDVTNRERLKVGWDAGNSWYEIQSEESGT
ncbi:unnamed protein product, partial [marine sediment metagenome]